MRPSAIYNLNPAELIPARKRLLEAHSEIHSWHRLARGLRLNVRYVYDFAVHGRLPRNTAIRRKLLGRRTINEHLSQDRIQDMPAPLLRWALENREEMA